MAKSKELETVPPGGYYVTVSDGVADGVYRTPTGMSPVEKKLKRKNIWVGNSVRLASIPRPNACLDYVGKHASYGNGEIQNANLDHLTFAKQWLENELKLVKQQIKKLKKKG